MVVLAEILHILQHHCPRPAADAELPPPTVFQLRLQSSQVNIHKLSILQSESFWGFLIEINKDCEYQHHYRIAYRLWQSVLHRQVLLVCLASLRVWRDVKKA